MISNSSNRVIENTDPALNQRIHRQAERNLAYFQSHPQEIGQRLEELDEEWDVERMLETGSSTLTLTGLLLGIIRGRKWLLLSLTVQAFFMQHALQGWCPPLPVLRRLGFRTQYEIEQERHALKALRGDFRRFDGPQTSNQRGSQATSSDEVLQAASK
jgi:hypothetical protein